MNHNLIKEKAKKVTKKNIKIFWIGYFTIFVISFLCSFGIALLFEKNSLIFNCLTLATTCFTATLTVGFYYYVLKIIRGEEVVKEDLFKFVGKVLPILAISILTTIFIFLWSLLFIIPGIIMALGYAMTLFIYVDNPEEPPMEYLIKSKEMMNGYKWDYFLFCLSFLGWILLGIITFGIALIWVIPYVSMAQGIYYEDLKNLKLKKEKEKF